MRSPRKFIAASVAAATVVAGALAAQPGPAAAKPGQPGKPAASSQVRGDTENVGPDYNRGKKLPVSKKSLAAAKQLASAKSSARAKAAAPTASKVGDTKTWLALNDSTGQIYVKSYKLRGLGNHIQVWVADDRAFPAGDCRNTLGLTNITDTQVNSFVGEFDKNIYPKESASFSVPPNRDGSGAELPGQIGQPADYYQVPATQADDIVVLVDNVKDANYSDPSSADGQTYIAGFFYSVFNDFVNRNVMTIDAFDWLHRTGANPPDDSTKQAYRDCTAAQGTAANRAYGKPRPHLYEGTFAHEYQHLLESYQDADEVNWVNEGLSDYAQTLVGYVDPSLPPDDPAADNHIASFLGFVGRSFGGPENSLTQWEDQGGPEVLADYGAAYSMMTYLEDKYGPRFMTDLHRAAGNGLEGLDEVLQDHGATKTAQETVHDWAAAMALDDATAADPSWSHNGPFSVDTLRAKVNWDTDQAYSTPGAPPNGSDYVRLRESSGRYLKAQKLKSLTFQGSTGLTPDKVAWVADPTPPNATTADTTCGAVPDGTGPTALYSGCGSNLDRSIAKEVTVPAGSPKMTFDALWDTEEGWDFGFLQVSTDGGKTYKSLPSTDTTTEHDAGAISGVVDNLPGFTGDSGGWRKQTVDLKAYAGQKVVLGFRYVTDSGVDEGGFWVRNVKVNTTAWPASTEGLQTYTQISPTPVYGFTVQLVGINSTNHKVFYKKLALNKSFKGSLSGKALKKAFGKKSQTVGAIVTYDEPTELAPQYARYKLTVNGDLQPGG
jgi:immune inhibitor InhA-like protein